MKKVLGILFDTPESSIGDMALKHGVTPISAGSSSQLLESRTHFANVELERESDTLPHSNIAGNPSVSRNPIRADVNSPSTPANIVNLMTGPPAEYILEKADHKEHETGSSGPTTPVFPTSYPSCSVKDADIRSSSSGKDIGQLHDVIAVQRARFTSLEQEKPLYNPSGVYDNEDNESYDKAKGVSRGGPTSNPLPDTTVHPRITMPSTELQTPDQCRPMSDPTQNVTPPRGPTVGSENSLAMVPYTGGPHFKAGCEAQRLPFRHRLSNLTPDDQQGLRFDAFNSNEKEKPMDMMVVSSLKRSANTPDQGGQSQWVVMSKEKAEEAAKKLQKEAEKSKTLQAKLEKHKHDRVLIYNAAMKQAAEREEEGINEVKRNFEREQMVMRTEVDQELLKINDLYDKRCRDYAQMVSDECEEEVSKATAELRKDWARQKKTIHQLVREGSAEDRKVAVIARAVMEQLQEEKKDEVAAIRAEIYANVKMEFENREAALRDSLQSEFQADLDGQLLLAEIRHQKEMDQLRMELRNDPVSPTDLTGKALVVYGGETTPSRRDDGSTESPNPSTPSPSLKRQSVQRKMPLNGESGNGRYDIGVVGASAVRPKSGLLRKLPSFRTPAQKVPPSGVPIKKAPISSNETPASEDIKTDDTEPDQPKSDATPRRRFRIKSSSLSKKGNVTKTLPEPLDSVPQDHQSEDFDCSITSALTVSPTKSSSGMMDPTPTEDLDDTCAKASVTGPQRPKKRKKRLFTGTAKGGQD